MRTCTRMIGFDSGHRILGHESKCANLHGHRYTAEITCAQISGTADAVDALGRVVDFSVIKEKIGDWIDKHWDHTMILNNRDPALQISLLQEKDVFHFPGNPTAENMAAFLFFLGNALLALDGIKVVKVRLWETPNCYADYEEGKTTQEDWLVVGATVEKFISPLTVTKKEKVKRVESATVVKPKRKFRDAK